MSKQTRARKGADSVRCNGSTSKGAQCRNRVSRKKLEKQRSKYKRGSLVICGRCTGEPPDNLPAHEVLARALATKVDDQLFDAGSVAYPPLPAFTSDPWVDADEQPVELNALDALSAESLAEVLELAISEGFTTEQAVKFLLDDVVFANCNPYELGAHGVTRVLTAVHSVAPLNDRSHSNLHAEVLGRLAGFELPDDALAFQPWSRLRNPGGYFTSRSGLGTETNDLEPKLLPVPTWCKGDETKLWRQHANSAVVEGLLAAPTLHPGLLGWAWFHEQHHRPPKIAAINRLTELWAAGELTVDSFERGELRQWLRHLMVWEDHPALATDDTTEFMLTVADAHCAAELAAGHPNPFDYDADPDRVVTPVGWYDSHDGLRIIPNGNVDGKQQWCGYEAKMEEGITFHSAEYHVGEARKLFDAPTCVWPSPKTATDLRFRTDGSDWGNPYSSVGRWLSMRHPPDAMLDMGAWHPQHAATVLTHPAASSHHRTVAKMMSTLGTDGLTAAQHHKVPVRCNRFVPTSSWRRDHQQHYGVDEQHDAPCSRGMRTSSNDHPANVEPASSRHHPPGTMERCRNVVHRTYYGGWCGRCLYWLQEFVFDTTQHGKPVQSHEDYGPEALAGKNHYFLTERLMKGMRAPPRWQPLQGTPVSEEYQSDTEEERHRLDREYWEEDCVFKVNGKDYKQDLKAHGPLEALEFAAVRRWMSVEHLAALVDAEPPLEDDPTATTQQQPFPWRKIQDRVYALSNAFEAGFSDYTDHQPMTLRRRVLAALFPATDTPTVVDDPAAEQTARNLDLWEACDTRDGLWERRQLMRDKLPQGSGLVATPPGAVVNGSSVTFYTAADFDDPDTSAGVTACCTDFAAGTEALDDVLGSADTALLVTDYTFDGDDPTLTVRSVPTGTHNRHPVAYVSNGSTAGRSVGQATIIPRRAPIHPHRLSDAGMLDKHSGHITFPASEPQRGGVMVLDCDTARSALRAHCQRTSPHPDHDFAPMDWSEDEMHNKPHAPLVVFTPSVDGQPSQLLFTTFEQVTQTPHLLSNPHRDREDTPPEVDGVVVAVSGHAAAGKPTDESPRPVVLPAAYVMAALDQATANGSDTLHLAWQDGTRRRSKKRRPDEPLDVPLVHFDCDPTGERSQLGVTVAGVTIPVPTEARTEQPRVTTPVAAPGPEEEYP